MTPEEMLKTANDARPDLMFKTAVALAATEKVSPEFAQEVISDFRKITDTTTEKVAAVGGWKGFAAGVGGSVLSAIGGALASDLYDAARRGLTKSTSFKRILEANPSLKSLPKKEVQTAFNTFHRFAPELTADPNLGGQILRTMVTLGENGDQRILVNELIKSRKDIRDVRKNQFHTGSVPFMIEEKEESNKGMTDLKALEKALKSRLEKA